MKVHSAISMLSFYICCSLIFLSFSWTHSTFLLMNSLKLCLIFNYFLDEFKQKPIPVFLIRQFINELLLFFSQLTRVNTFFDIFLNQFFFLISYVFLIEILFIVLSVISILSVKIVCNRSLTINIQLRLICDS